MSAGESVLAELQAPAEFLKTRERFFQSVRALDVYVDQHRQALAKEGALLFIAGRHFIHPQRFEQIMLAIGARDALQQSRRMGVCTIAEQVLAYLHGDPDAGDRPAPGAEVQEIVLATLLARIGIPVDRQTADQLRQASKALADRGWIRKRSSHGARPWVYRRPADDAAEA